MNLYLYFTAFVIVWTALCVFYFDSKKRTIDTAGRDFIALMIGVISIISWVLITAHFSINYLWN